MFDFSIVSDYVGEHVAERGTVYTQKGLLLRIERCSHRYIYTGLVVLPGCN